MLLLLFAFVGCKSRVNTPASSTEPSLPSSVEPTPPPSSEPPSSEDPSSSSESESSAITDTEQVTQAREIVSELLEKAAVADEIYRAVLRSDTIMDPMMLEDKEYCAITDERFVTVDDITAAWNQTFTKGGRASDLFDELRDEMVYVSMNGELYMSTIERPIPLTMGAWEIETMELLLMDEQQLECRMQATLLGEPEGEKVLRIVRDGDYWLLGDSYFLD